jgi:hypothetical protein
MSVIKGTLISYDTLSRIAGVNIAGRGIIAAENIIGPNTSLPMELVNTFLSLSEIGTVTPSSSFTVGDIVAIVIDNGQYKLLGITAAAYTPTNYLVTRKSPGAIDLNQDITTDDTGNYIIEEFGERCQINTIKVTKSTNTEFSLSIYGSNNNLQASWGNGSTTILKTFEDNAGFGFRSPDRSLYLFFDTPGVYSLQITGERFA